MAVRLIRAAYTRATPRALPCALVDGHCAARHREAEGVDVVAVGGAGLPPGVLFGQGGGHGRPVQHGARGQPPADGGQASLVGEQLADGDRVLARSGELGPVCGDGRVEVELALGA